MTTAPAGQQTSGQLAAKVTGNLLSGSRRRLTMTNATDAQRYPFLHVGTWGPPKAGKTDLGLRSRSHEIWLTGEPTREDPFARPRTQLLLPSKPLFIAYANFDRDASSVLSNLPGDVDVIEERFYVDSNGEPLLMPDRGQLQVLITRLSAFFNEAEAEGVDMVVLDGGTIVWDNVRELRLANVAPQGTDPGGEPRLLPRQYGPANAEMRASVMQRLFGLRAHTYLTREAGERWSGQNSPLLDASGDVVLRPDGWNKTGHYVDLDGLFKVVQTGQGMKRWYIPDVSIRPALIGKTLVDPSFQELYKLCYPMTPLLKRSDLREFEQLQATHGNKLTW